MRPLSFSIANFKSFGSKLSEVPLRPITLVFGPNSAGKSSLLQALMYLDEVLTSGELDVISPRLGRGKVDLGGFKQILHRRGGMRHIVLGLTFPATIIPKPDRNWWPMEKGFSINLTLGPIPYSGELGTQGLSLEVDGQELLRASRIEEGPMKIDLFDFTHPVMSNLLAAFSYPDDSLPAPADATEAMVDFYEDEYQRESMLGYFNFAVLRGCFEVATDEILPRALKIKARPDVTDTPDKELHIQMTLFERNWRERLELFLEDTLPGAFKSLFSAFSGYSKSCLSSIRHVPPLRDLPPRVFDLNHHPDALWRRIANQAELRIRINNWLGSKFMKTRYALHLREYAPVDEITSRVPGALDAQMMSLLEKQGFGTDVDFILNDLSERFDQLDRVDYVNSHPELLERLIENELDNFESWAATDDPHDRTDPDWALMSPRDKRTRAEELVEDVLANDSSAYPEVWHHYKNNDPDLRQFLSQHWDPQSAAKVFNYFIVPNTLETRKEIALRELPGNVNVSLQDVGVGISQVLPVLMNAFGEQGSIIAIEQPEIHIHPALQAELGDVFIESALGENKNTFLLETHSEHLILRILRRIRETTEEDFSDWPEALKKACPNGIRPEDVAVIYVQPGEEGARVLELPVDSNGEFSCDWPGGFFEERMKELF
jgi:hypothetical protein